MLRVPPRQAPSLLGSSSDEQPAVQLATETPSVITFGQWKKLPHLRWHPFPNYPQGLPDIHLAVRIQRSCHPLASIQDKSAGPSKLYVTHGDQLRLLLQWHLCSISSPDQSRCPHLLHRYCFHPVLFNKFTAHKSPSQNLSQGNWPSLYQT